MDDPIRWIREEIRRTRSKVACREERLAQLQVEVAALKDELRKLEITADVLERRFKFPLFSDQIEVEEGASADHEESSGSPLRAVDVSVPETSDWPNGNSSALNGKSIKDAAIKILSEHQGQWMEFRDVADQAIRRGYQSTKTFSTEASVTRSFFDVMRKMTELERDKSRFRLAPSNTNGQH